MRGWMDSLHTSSLCRDLWIGKPCNGLGLQPALDYSTLEAQGARLTSIQSHARP